MKKVIIFVGIITLLILVSSAFTGSSISVMSILNNLASTSDVISSQGADMLFKRVYEVSPSITNFTLTGDWGAFDFLRPAVIYIVRALGLLLDIGNYAVWFVNALWTGLIYLVNLTGLLLGLG